MPDVSLPTSVDALIVVGLATGALTTIALFLTKTGRAVRWLAEMAREAFIEGARDGITEIVSQQMATVDTDLSEIRRDLTDIRGQLRVNGGTSLRDAIDRIERKQQQDSEALWLHIADDHEHD